MSEQERKPVIYTSYFAKCGREPNAVSIARYSPKWFKGERYTPLAPQRHIFGLKGDKFREKYDEQLAKLNARKIANELDGKILLCYEVPPNPCHRHYVAEWLTKAGLAVVKEWEPPNASDTLF